VNPLLEGRGESKIIPPLWLNCLGFDTPSQLVGWGRGANV